MGIANTLFQGQTESIRKAHMITSQAEFAEYIKTTYPDVTDCLRPDRRVFDTCPTCRVRMGLDVVKKQFVAVTYSKTILAYMASSAGRRLPQPPNVEKQKPDPAYPSIVSFVCPECKFFRRWVLYTVESRIYRLSSIPSEHEIDTLPETSPALRRAYSEAMRAWDANCPMAAVVMFRRALQIITRDILQAPPGNLGNELRNLRGRNNAMGITLTQDFHENAFILKETANQAAHPDQDPDLLEFTDEDARSIHTLFLDIVTELFVVPAAEAKARADMVERRKLTTPRQQSN